MASSISYTVVSLIVAWYFVYVLACHGLICAGQERSIGIYQVHPSLSRNPRDRQPPPQAQPHKTKASADVARPFDLRCLIVYVYVLYPLILKLLTSLGSKSNESPGKTCRPLTISLIIPAFNESKVIRRKLDNSLSINYPKDLLEIIVASDGSDDGTNEIVEDYLSSGVVLRAFSPRAGKISVLNRTIPEARGEVVVLCDANVMFDPEAIARMAAHLADPKIGAVTGDVRIQSEDAPFGESEGLTTSTSDSSNCTSRRWVPR